MRSFDVDDRPSNDRYESDIRYTFQLCRWILKPIGIYPFVDSRASKLQRTISLLLIVVCCSIMQFIIVPFGHYILFYEKDTNVRIKFLGPFAFCLTTLFKYGYLGLKGSAFERCIVHVERDWKMLRDQNHRDIMYRHITMGRNLIMMCVMFLYTGGLSYHTILPLLSKRKINENFTIRPLTYPGYEAFFDIQKSPTYEIVYCVHCAYVLIASNVSIAAYSLTTIFASHACGQMKIQTLTLENPTKERGLEGKGDGDRLAVVVRNHAEILRFTRNVEAALCEICLMEVVVSILLICLLEYYCMMEWETNDSIGILTYFVLLISFTFNILIFCYTGELLLEQVVLKGLVNPAQASFMPGNKIASASYETKWYELPGRKARGIILLLAISKYPPKLTAGKIFVLSFNTFAVILKSTIVCLNMLRKITEL